MLGTYLIKATNVEIKSNFDILAGVVAKKMQGESCDILWVRINSNFMASARYESMRKTIFDTTFFNNAFLVPILLEDCYLGEFEGLSALSQNKFVDKFPKRLFIFCFLSQRIKFKQLLRKIKSYN